MSNDNARRAGYARAAAAEYVWRRDRVPSFTALYVTCPDDAEDYLADLITDLLHLARELGFSPEGIAATARLHHEKEESGL